MRLISINILKEGMVIGRTIWNEAGHPLLQEGVVVSERMIKRLNELNVRYLYIDDQISNGIKVTETVPLDIRSKTVSKISDSFKSLKGLKSNEMTYVLDKQSKELNSVVEQLLNAVLQNKEILTVLTDAYLYDEYLYNHSYQVTLYSLSIAKELGYSEKELRIIGMGAILHDVGKMQVSHAITTKPGRLTDEEFEEMKLHTRYGFDILRSLHSVSLIVAHCAFQHHERIDGSGYPRGLMDYEIHPYAKIIGVADVFDAVTSNRVYRAKMQPAQGIAILEAGAGTIYDARVVEALKRTVVHYPNGTVVKLSDGRRGVVAKQNIKNPLDPSIRIFEVEGQIISPTYEIKLSQQKNVKINLIETDYTVHSE